MEEFEIEIHFNDDLLLVEYATAEEVDDICSNIVTGGPFKIVYGNLTGPDAGAYEIINSKRVTHVRVTPYNTATEIKVAPTSFWSRLKLKGTN